MDNKQETADQVMARWGLHDIPDRFGMLPAPATYTAPAIKAIQSLEAENAKLKAEMDEAEKLLDEAVEQLAEHEPAQELDPYDPKFDYALALFWGNYEEWAAKRQRDSDTKHHGGGDE